MPEPASESDLQALERFVVENDELLELEERIGRFNIFDALGVARAEIRHSNFLAWLLDPAESHGQGALFLRAILMDLLRTARENDYACPISPIHLDGEDLSGVEIRREWRRIDLLITCDEPRFAIAVENKIDAGEHGGQLKRYRDAVCEGFDGAPSMCVFLTTDGAEPSDEEWVPYTYADIHRVLTRVRRTNVSAIGDDVRVVLDHYLGLIGSRFMDDPKIDELCRRIYQNHRRALDVIIERIESPQRAMLDRIEQFLLSHPDRWHVFSKTAKKADFLPVSWVHSLPTLKFGPADGSPDWMRWWFYCRPTSCRLLIDLGPVGNPLLTQMMMDRLTADPSEFGFKGKAKVHPESWTRLYTCTVTKWPEENEPDDTTLFAAVTRTLDVVERRLAGVPDALRPIIAEWEATRRDASP